MQCCDTAMTLNTMPHLQIALLQLPKFFITNAEFSQGKFFF